MQSAMLFYKNVSVQKYAGSIMQNLYTTVTKGIINYIKGNILYRRRCAMRNTILLVHVVAIQTKPVGQR